MTNREGADPRSDLRALLGDEAVAALAPLGEVQLRELLALIQDARERESEALREAAESSLGFVPRFARAAVKKIVFG